MPPIIKITIVEHKQTPKEVINDSIIEAAVSEQINIVKYLLIVGVDINHRHHDGCTILHYFAQDGTQDMVKYLVESGAHMNTTCRGKETPLKWAFYGKNTNLIKYLKKKGAMEY
ncbi:MAG: ankyrin repeat domain-containing protein [Candidatus Thiodiazotropha sp. (ex Epidulcina cf. delphinae)]|nr:ankyrin repeat domain-containing protein [Candidatus Thiodiazotropha sp. (ex Epidulcina cf. delphinae)]